MNNLREPTLKGLIMDLNALGSSNNRLAILGLQLYAEHYVNEIVMEQVKDCAKSEVRKYLTFPQKLRVLKKMKIIDEDKKRILEMLNSIRDTFVHELVISTDEINKKLRFAQLGFNYTWRIKVKNKVNEIRVIDLVKEYKEKIPNKYNQLVISGVILIGILYHNLMVMRGKVSNEFIDVNFAKAEDKWVANLTAKSFGNPKS
ncbi:MAG: hypothetical protein Q8N88_03495 [Nanoarchaeota archaeon]|nr:hypothetical protein [Nanoarchaeota archaeon]